MGEFVPRPKTLGGESNLETPVKTQADGAPLFRISDLSAGYDKKVVVEGVELEVRSGDVVALIGPNGSGKSTILKPLHAIWHRLPARSSSTSGRFPDGRRRSSQGTLPLC